jgi:competence protein ComGC
MKTASTHTSPRRQNGFSFFEMMMFVAIIGIIVAIVVPMWGSNDAFYAARDRRNAQELASICTMAQAAGLNFVGNKETVSTQEELLEILSDISQGDVVSKGSLKGRSFSVPGLSREDLEGAAKYITVENGALRYSVDMKPQTRGAGNL